jgi:drug/metabolite transporter (DMT)-like permease
MTDQGKAYAQGLAAVLLWSTVASAFKLTLRHLDYVQLLLYSSIASVLLLGSMLVFRGRIASAFACSRRQYARSLVLGLLNPFLYYLVLFKAYDLLPAQVAQPLNYTWALTLALLSVPLLGQRLRRTDLAAGLVSYTGVLVISTRGDFSGFRLADPLGVGLALASTVVWALFWIYSTKDDRDPLLSLFLNFLFGLPFVLLFCVLFSDVRVLSLPGLAGAAYVGVVEMGVAFVLWLSALKLSRDTAGIGYLIFVSPFLSLVFIRLLVGEHIAVSTYVGLSLIVAGLLAQRVCRGREAGPAGGATG